jgi:5-formyltetrahydrofolate cyclo-ligase
MRDARDALSGEQVAHASAAASAHVLAHEGMAPRGMRRPLRADRRRQRARDAPSTSGVARSAAPRLPGGAPAAMRRTISILVDDVEDLRPSRLGIPQPDPSTPVVPLDSIDVFLVPGLAFDLEGERLGWGRGHYDRTLVRAPEALRVGYAFELQVVDRVPVGADDQRIDVLVTETGARQAPPRRSR